MIESNNSPWIHQLRRTRPVESLEENLYTDIVIVGGGIAGITTAYFMLTQTNKKIVLVEAGKIAHGATGHNAGQITSYFEKPFREIVNRFGLSKAARAQQAIEEDARSLLEKIFSHAELTTPHSEFVGYDGSITLAHVLEHLMDMELKAEAGLRIRPLLVSHEWEEHQLIPLRYAGLYTLTSHNNILSLLETEDKRYIAALPFLSGCMNSALFSEELTGYLLSVYKDRFILKEHSPVKEVLLENTKTLVRTETNTITAQYVILCTNGFKSLNILHQTEKDINKKFHENIKGIVAYMAAYKEVLNKAPFASYYSNEHELNHELYYYVTRRPYEDASNAKHNLVCIGGPETFLPDRATYDAKKTCPVEIMEAIENFAAQTYKRNFKPLDYCWHGLMGYTHSGLRIVGPEPRNNRLFYNVGCNGVGILTSIFGANRLAQIINGEVVAPMIFDPEWH